jgi:hypothetical protein
MSAEHAMQESIIDTMIAFKSRGWKAITPLKPAKAVVVLIGSKEDGWQKVLTLREDDRFERARILVDRYNAAPQIVMKA